MLDSEYPLLQSRYNLYFRKKDVPGPEGLRFDGSLLSNEEALNDFLSAFATAINSPRKEVTGSLFIKRYVSLIAGAIHAFSLYNRCLDLSLDHIYLVLQKDKLLAVLEYEDAPEIICQTNDRAEQRKLLIHHMYHTNIKPMWSAIIHATGISGTTLWATLSYLVAYWKEEDLRTTESAELRAQIEEDYRFFANQAWVDSFADCPINPIYSFFKKVDIEGDTIALRAKCCLLHCLPGEDRHCYTCPRITEEERVRKYKALH